MPQRLRRRVSLRSWWSGRPRGVRREPRGSLLRRLEEKSAALEAANRDLAAREARLRAIVDNEPECIKLVAPDGSLLEINQAGLRMIEADRFEQVVGARLDALVIPEHRPAFDALMERALRGEPGRLAFEIVGLKGGRRWLETHVSPLQGESGAVTAILGLTRDVTERRSAEAALQISEERLRLAVRASNVGLFDWDLQTSQVAYSPEWKRQLGHDDHEIGASLEEWRSRVHPDDLGPVMATVSRNLSRPTPQGYEVEFRMRHKDGSWRWIYTRAEVICDERGAPARILGCHVDITARKRAEEALRESEARFRQLAESIDEVFYITDLAVNRVIYVSPAYERVWGRSRASLVESPRAWIETVVPEDRERVLAAMARGGALDEEYRIRHPDGALRWIHDRAFAVDAAVGRIVGVAQDITARKRAEAERRRLEVQVRHAQKLESLGVLAGGIAHDFNNLLTGVLGYADLALFELPASSPARELVGKVIESARRAAELTAQMLAYSGRGHFMVEVLDLSLLVRDMGRLLAASVSKRCVLRCDLGPGLPAIEGDPAQVRQVVMNLVVNASEAIGEASGVIEVATRVIHCDRACLDAAYLSDGLGEGEYVALEVSDTGVGMTEETRARIFDPFFTTKFTGRGLGLSVVLGIVRGHRGAIQCRSAPGEGTTFRVLFPAATQPARAAEGEGPRPRAQRGAALVVDDEPSVRGLASEMLSSLGFAAIAAADGQEGVEVFEAAGEAIRLVLLDLTMPRLDGAAALNELRRLRADVPVILMSGYNEERAQSRLPSSGVAAFLQKPFTLADLRAAVERALARAGEGAAAPGG